MTPWASLLTNGSGSLIRFNVMASTLLEDCDWVSICRTESGSHIVIKPIRLPQWKIDLINYKSKIYRKAGKYPEIKVGSFISSGFFPAAIFNQRYKVKKDKNGWLYICLKEPVEKGE